MFDNILTQKPNGVNLKEAIRSDRHWLVCRTCRKRHEFYPLSESHRAQQFTDFEFKHRPENGCYVYLLTPEEIERVCRRAERRRKFRRESVVGFSHNADVKVAFQGSDQSVDLTSFNSLANSATAGWSSHYIDNSTNLYLDFLFAVTIAAVNTAPGSDQRFYFYAAASFNTTDRPATGASSGICANSSSTSATLTFPSISTTTPVFPLAWAQPYNTQNIAQQSPTFGYARALGGIAGLFCWLPAINFSGMTIAASGNAIKYRGAYNTVT